MKNITLGILVFATGLAITPAAFASSLIVGTIGISGGNDKWSSTAMTFTTPSGTVTDETGNFVGIVPMANPTTINAGVLTYATPDVLWFTTSTGDASLTITGPVDVTEETGTNLQISGVGILTLTGYAPTLATFNSDSTDSSGNYGASSSSTWGIDVTSEAISPAPEPGTLVMLGTGLFGLAGLLRRKMLT
ncbi:MAG: PEP-CTERM sorting domain-containing protein [Terracidiphilus sp.]|jgi:hypothetical protein